MVLIVPLLGRAASAAAIAGAIGFALGKASLVVVGTIVDRPLRRAARRSRGWTRAAAARCSCWPSSASASAPRGSPPLVGLSLALGAFLGGMVVADTEYGHRAMGDILPLRDAFVSIFFVSLGMLFDVRVVSRTPLLVGTLLLGFLVAKGVLATLAAMAMRFPPRVAWLAGVGLAQFGEFGFVLTRLASSESGVIDDARRRRPLLAAGIISMFLTPLLVRAAPHIRAGERCSRPSSADRRAQHRRSRRRAPKLEGHVVIVGFGLAGRYAARASASAGPTSSSSSSTRSTCARARSSACPSTTATPRAKRRSATRTSSDARLVVLLMNDPQAAQRVVDTVRRVSPATSPS
jgi:CPA2 family monovalent cation:H+ antiporter-2